MLQIRRNVFETNSSSSHSIVVMKEAPARDKLTDMMDWFFSQRELHFYEDDLSFGRAPFDVLDDWYGRLRYALALFAYDDVMRDRITEILRKRLPNFEEFVFPQEPWYNEDEDDTEYQYFYGSVDHQSMDLLSKFLTDHDISLEDFIFDDRYIVIIDGDEYHVFDRIQHMASWNKDAIEEIYNA